MDLTRKRSDVEVRAYLACFYYSLVNDVVRTTFTRDRCRAVPGRYDHTALRILYGILRTNPLVSFLDQHRRVKGIMTYTMYVSCAASFGGPTAPAQGEVLNMLVSIMRSTGRFYYGLAGHPTFGGTG